MMDLIKYIENELFIEGCSAKQLALKYSTPLFVYSEALIKYNWKQFSLPEYSNNHLICYAVKANSNISVLNILAKMGSGFDVVSQGELARVIFAGGDPKRTIFSGVGKKSSEISYALSKGIFSFNVESESELYRINEVAKKLDKIAPISIRVNPDVSVKTHPYISTGLKENKFGVKIENAKSLYLKAKQLKHVELKGIDCHIGSQIMEIEPFLDSIDRMLLLVDELIDVGISLTHINVGGGVGVQYNNESPLTPKDYVKAIATKTKEHKLKVIFEPGRAIVANAGVLLTEVEYLKCSSDKNFAIVDAAMNDLLRPALYDACHKILPVTEQENIESRVYDVVGPVCETGDFLGKNRTLAICEGDYLSIFSCGAYSFSMSSNYNSRPKSAEVLISGNKDDLIGIRQTTTDLWRDEILV
jgi:diaminopimelate decarboxylase